MPSMICALGNDVMMRDDKDEMPQRYTGVKKKKSK